MAETEKAVRLNRNDVESWLGKVESLTHLGKPEGTIICFDEVLKLRFDYGKAQYT